jgi:hypothetical protein
MFLDYQSRQQGFFVLTLGDAAAESLAASNGAALHASDTWSAGTTIGAGMWGNAVASNRRYYMDQASLLLAAALRSGAIGALAPIAPEDAAAVAEARRRSEGFVGDPSLEARLCRIESARGNVATLDRDARGELALVFP